MSPKCTPFAVSAEGDAIWYRRLDAPAAEDALIDWERREGSPPGDELVNAEGAGRRVRLVWLRIVPPPVGEDGWSSWEVVPRPGPDDEPAIECWEVL